MDVYYYLHFSDGKYYQVPFHIFNSEALRLGINKEICYYLLYSKLYKRFLASAIRQRLTTIHNIRIRDNSFPTNSMIVYIENPRNVMCYQNEWRKANKDKYMKAFPYMSSNNQKMKLQQHKKKIKYLEISATRYVSDLYPENYKALPRQIKEDLSIRRMYHAHGLKGCQFFTN